MALQDRLIKLTSLSLDVCMESSCKYWIPVYDILEHQSQEHKKAIIAITKKIFVAIYSMNQNDADFLPSDQEETLP